MFRLALVAALALLADHRSNALISKSWTLPRVVQHHSLVENSRVRLSAGSKGDSRGGGQARTGGRRGARGAAAPRRSDESPRKKNAAAPGRAPARLTPRITAAAIKVIPKKDPKKKNTSSPSETGKETFIDREERLAKEIYGKYVAKKEAQAQAKSERKAEAAAAKAKSLLASRAQRNTGDDEMGQTDRLAPWEAPEFGVMGDAGSTASLGNARVRFKVGEVS